MTCSYASSRFEVGGGGYHLNTGLGPPPARVNIDVPPTE